MATPNANILPSSAADALTSTRSAEGDGLLFLSLSRRCSSSAGCKSRRIAVTQSLARPLHAISATFCGSNLPAKVKRNGMSPSCTRAPNDNGTLRSICPHLTSLLRSLSRPPPPSGEAVISFDLSSPMDLNDEDDVGESQHKKVGKYPSFSGGISGETKGKEKFPLLPSLYSGIPFFSPQAK